MRLMGTGRNILSPNIAINSAPCSGNHNGNTLNNADVVRQSINNATNVSMSTNKTLPCSASIFENYALDNKFL